MPASDERWGELPRLCDAHNSAIGQTTRLPQPWWHSNSAAAGARASASLVDWYNNERSIPPAAGHSC